MLRAAFPGRAVRPLFLALLTLAPAWLTAQAGGPAVATVGPGGLLVQPLAPYDHLTLAVSTPDGQVFEQDFEAGAPVRFDPFGVPGYAPPDGVYVWEVRLSPVPRRLRTAEEANDPARRPVRGISILHGGSFRVMGGAVTASPAP
jgi:hypothetical protein